jgi:3-hydroxybutyryl-CoA dehydrogenase
MAEVHAIAVVGAGVMGRGIAQVAAQSGFDTTLVDVSAEILGGALAAIKSSLKKGVEKGKITDDAMIGALSRLDLDDQLERGVASADLVIEAVPERIDLKIATLQRAHAATKAAAIFATNTSSMSITEIAAGSGRPERVVGMHFFNPVPIMRLVEVIRGLESGPDAVETVLAVARAMGKETVEVRESPGFVTSRMNALIGNEAFRMLEEGVASAEEIDRALKLGLNHPMGPFELVDLVGLDTRLSILEYLHGTLGERFRPTPLMVQYVKAGRLGRKVGRGVYDYRDGAGREGDGGGVSDASRGGAARSARA